MRCGRSAPLQNCWTRNAAGRGNPTEVFVVQSDGTTDPLSPTGLHPMDQLSGYAHHPFRFVLRYLRQRPASHLVILTCVVAAVACSTGTQYGVKFLVDSLSAGPSHATNVWLAFA